MRRRLLMGGQAVKKNHIILNQNIFDPAKIISGDINSEAIQWIRANSHRYLGKYIGDGAMTICQLDDSDSNYYADGAAADLTGAQGDVFMKLPTFFYHAEEIEPDIWDIGFGQTAEASDWKEWNGNDLIGVYEASGDGQQENVIYSVSGLMPLSVFNSQENLKLLARNKGEGFSLVKFKHHSILAFLFYAMYGNTNCQAICGAGADMSGCVPGRTDELGMTDTGEESSYDIGAVNFWGLENWWGCDFEFIDNVTVNNHVWTITEDDGSTREVQAGTENGYISKISIGENLDMVPIAVGGSSSSGFCDYYTQVLSNDLVLARSYSEHYSNGGVACAHAGYRAQSSDLVFGSRLAFRGELNEVFSSDEYLSLYNPPIILTLNNTGNVSSNNVIVRTQYNPQDVNTFFSKFMLVEQTGYDASSKTMTVSELNPANKKRYNGSAPTGNVFLLTPEWCIEKQQDTQNETIKLTYHLSDSRRGYPRYRKLIGVYPLPLNHNGVFSKSGSPNMVNMSQEQLRELLQPYGLDLMTDEAYNEIKELYMLRYLDTNIENTIGTGVSGSYLTSLGDCDSLGITDTSLTTTTRTNLIGLEGIFGDQPEFTRDAMFEPDGTYSRISVYDKLGNEKTIYHTDLSQGISGRVMTIKPETWMATSLNETADRNMAFSSIQYFSSGGSYKLVGGNFNGPTTSNSNYDCGVFYCSFNNNPDTLSYKGGRAMFMGKIVLNKHDGTTENINFD